MPLEPGSEHWQRISKALFQNAPLPPDEAFVARVMSRVAAEEGRTDPSGWLKPALSLAFAAATAMLAFSWTLQTETSSGDILTVASAGWLSAQTPVGTDELLGVSVEDR